MSDEQLKNKIRKALEDSGFPLELKMSKILEKHNWNHSICCRYEDFETEIIRELDICAEKNINGIAVHLNIECKKSSNKQLILYTPTPKRNKKLPVALVNHFKYFPRIDKSNSTLEKRVLNEFRDLPILSDEYQPSRSIIFTKGDKIEQNNDSFFSSLNGIIKKSVVGASDGYIETNFRIIYLHIVIYDGLIYILKNSDDNDFDLQETRYGQYEFRYNFRIKQNVHSDIIDTARHFSFMNLIEIMHPNYFEDYISSIEHTIANTNKKKLNGWGVDWDDYLNMYYVNGQ